MGETLERLTILADSSLYASKNGGKDRVTIADPLSVPPIPVQHGTNGHAAPTIDVGPPAS